jgi:hypothetical protein
MARMFALHHGPYENAHMREVIPLVATRPHMALKLPYLAAYLVRDPRETG